MKKLLLILLCLPLVYSCGDKEMEDDDETLLKESTKSIIKEIDSISNKKKEINFLQKEKNSLKNQIKEDSIKKVLLENYVNEQERSAKDKFLIKKNNEDVIIKKKISEGNGNSDTTKGGKDGKDGYYGNRIPVEIPHPKGYSNKKGVVIVQINVNPEGLVTFAKIVPSFGHKNTTSFDPILRKNSLNAALRSKFTVGDTNDIGYMIYSFDFH